MLADVWKKDVWDFQAKPASSGSCCLFLHFLGTIAVQKVSGRTHLEVPDILLPDIPSLLIHGGTPNFKIMKRARGAPPGTTMIIRDPVACRKTGTN